MRKNVLGQSANREEMDGKRMARGSHEQETCTSAQQLASLLLLLPEYCDTAGEGG